MSTFLFKSEQGYDKTHKLLWTMRMFFQKKKNVQLHKKEKLTYYQHLYNILALLVP